MLPPAIHSESVQQKRDLASWWKNFKRSDKKAQEQQQGTHEHSKRLEGFVFGP